MKTLHELDILTIERIQNQLNDMIQPFTSQHFLVHDTTLRLGNLTTKRFHAVINFLKGKQEAGMLAYKISPRLFEAGPFHHIDVTKVNVDAFFISQLNFEHHDIQAFKVEDIQRENHIVQVPALDKLAVLAKQLEMLVTTLENPITDENIQQLKQLGQAMVHWSQFYQQNVSSVSKVLEVNATNEETKSVIIRKSLAS